MRRRSTIGHESGEDALGFLAAGMRVRGSIGAKGDARTCKWTWIRCVACHEACWSPSWQEEL
jgi:hypothetical protein